MSVLYDTPRIMESGRVSLLRRRLLSGGSWAFAGRLVASVGQLAINALVARLLSPQDLGAYFLAFSVVALGAIVGPLGLNQAAVRFVAESMGLDQPGRTRRVVGLALAFGTLGAFGVGLLYVPLGYYLGTNLFHSPALAATAGLVGAWMTVMALQSLLAEIFRGFHDIRQATLFGGLLSVVLLSVCLGLLWLMEGQATLGAVLLVAVVSVGASLVLAGWRLRRRLAGLPRERVEGRVDLVTMFRVAGPLLVTNLTLFALTQADLWILGAFRSQEEVAVYGAAARLVILVVVPLFVVNAVLPPLIAEMYAQGRIGELGRTLRATAALAAIPASLALLVFVFAGGPCLGLVYGDYYRDGATVLAILSLGQLVNVWVGSCGLTLGMTNHQSLYMLISVACGAFAIVAGVLVVGPFGTVGVATASATGLILLSLLMWLGARYTTGVWTHVAPGMLPDLLRRSGSGGRE